MNSAKLLETLTTLKAQIEELQANADPFALHVYASRKLYREPLNCRKHSRSTAWEYKLLQSYHEAQRQQYRGTYDDWMLVLRAGGT